MKKQAKSTTKPPFKESYSAKNLLSQWLLNFVFVDPVVSPLGEFSDRIKKDRLISETLLYILSDAQFNELNKSKFDKATLEKLLHQTAG